MTGYQMALNSLSWKEVTLWYRFTNNGLEYNHLADGHVIYNEPVPPCGQNWSGRWSKLFTYMKDGIVQ